MWKNKEIISCVIILGMAVMAAGCATSPKVTRMDVAENVDLSGRWNDTDSRMVSEAMISDCLGKPWLNRFFQEHQSKPPVVIVQSVSNRSHEHINTQLFTKDLERAFINSGMVDVVASKDERKELREERTEHTLGFTSAETSKSFGKEIGADFALQGAINTAKDQVKGKYLIFYQVNLELVSLESNRKTWIGEKKIKKLVERPGVKW
ncbi:MAG: penicillin-binding protein activator LpoB [Proteobacteria bacterium]|nr:penicillin-binding protein activator LpoB [Pseudomonadota bacterium]